MQVSTAGGPTAASFHPLQPGTGRSCENRNSLPHHFSCQTQQDKLTCSVSAVAAPSSPVHGFQLCRLPPFPGKMRQGGKTERFCWSAVETLHQSPHLGGWGRQNWSRGPPSIMYSKAQRAPPHNIYGEEQSPASPAEKQLINPYGCPLLAAHQPCISMTSGCITN